jgi:hypothetical protein
LAPQTKKLSLELANQGLAVWMSWTVVPFMPGEENKLETEAQDILGSISSEGTSFHT